jgi:hypothetical protein
VGRPEALAKAIIQGTKKLAPRVIYPPFFGPAAEMLSVARRFTERFSPAPRA